MRINVKDALAHDFFKKVRRNNKKIELDPEMLESLAANTKAS